MIHFLFQKGSLIGSVLVVVFVVAYIVFSSLTTSLDFEMDRLLKQQTVLSEEYDLIFADAVKSRSRSALLAAKDSLGLVEIVLAEGYVDVRPETVPAENLAIKP